MTIYLDNNATTRPADEVVQAMTAALTEHWHNPSSIHRQGQIARLHVEQARQSVGELLHCHPREIVFLSGGTEADNYALYGSLAAQPDRKVVVTDRLEHSAVRETAKLLAERGIEVIWLEVDRHGVIDVEYARRVIRQRAKEIALVSVMWANNETGAIQPIEEIAALCREQEVRCHTDGVQWVGKMPTNLRDVPIDMLSFAAHKFYGPKGIGGLFVRRGVKLVKQVTGGPHEREMRGGTENVPGIVGLGAAARLASQWLESGEMTAQARRRDRLEEGIRRLCPDVIVNSAGAKRVWNTSNLGFPRLESEAILIMMSEKGLCAAAGAACSTGSLEPSPVLLAMGVPREVAHGSIRLSLSRETTDAEIDQAIEITGAVVSRLRKAITV